MTPLYLLSLSLAVFCCSNTVPAPQYPLKAITETQILHFDDLDTHHGWGDLPANYNYLDFEGFLVFTPSDPALEHLIRPDDLKCAKSSPNALYGTRYNFQHSGGDEPTKLPGIALTHSANTSSGRPISFELQSLQIKPRDAPLAYTKISLRGHQPDNKILDWHIDFPAGFTEMVKVDIQAFAKRTWRSLEKLEIWADFHNEDLVIDWEYCLDDLEIKLEYE